MDAQYEDPFQEKIAKRKEVITKQKKEKKEIKPQLLKIYRVLWH